MPGSCVLDCCFLEHIPTSCVQGVTTEEELRHQLDYHVAEATGQEGWSLLHLAIRSRSSDMVRMCLEWGICRAPEATPQDCGRH